MHLFLDVFMTADSQGLVWLIRVFKKIVDMLKSFSL